LLFNSISFKDRRKKNKSDNCTTVLYIVAMIEPVKIQRNEPLDARGNTQINHLKIYNIY